MGHKTVPRELLLFVGSLWASKLLCLLTIRSVSQAGLNDFLSRCLQILLLLSQISQPPGGVIWEAPGRERPQGRPTGAPREATNSVLPLSLTIHKTSPPSFLFFRTAEVEPWALGMTGKRPTSELHPQLSRSFLLSVCPIWTLSSRV